MADDHIHDVVRHRGKQRGLQMKKAVEEIVHDRGSSGCDGSEVRASRTPQNQAAVRMTVSFESPDFASPF
ncbi:hypothetical protein [Paraburkholderia flagellata]|uniref:hypothetical protein n=1 Tax=Paraburkholderia flagellata TaxID=2883241 RepID=UPI001F48418B|nr:hypothetical protein [Paraburkholderia flagellata]